MTWRLRTVVGQGALMIDIAATGGCVGRVGINYGPLSLDKTPDWLVYDGQE